MMPRIEHYRKVATAAIAACAAASMCFAAVWAVDVRAHGIDDPVVSTVHATSGELANVRPGDTVWFEAFQAGMPVPAVGGTTLAHYAGAPVEVDERRSAPLPSTSAGRTVRIDNHDGVVTYEVNR